MTEPDPTENLVTPTSLALSLSPPRAPPHDSVHRMLLVGKDPTKAPLFHYHDHEKQDDDDHGENDHHHHHSVRSRVLDLLRSAHLTVPHAASSVRLPHPHLPAGPELADRMTRALGTFLPLTWQNKFRDSGRFRSLADSLVTLSVPMLAVTNPSAVYEFVQLSNQCQRLRYGQHPMQIIDLFLPNALVEFNDESKSRNYSNYRGLLFFVHGGAWGSGQPWMYRLVASVFLRINMAVAIVGYRTYPCADVEGQVDDLERAASELKRKHPELFVPRGSRGEKEDGRGLDRMNCMDLSGQKGWIGTCLMGHSSGAHISLLMLVERVRKHMINALIEREKGIDTKNNIINQPSADPQSEVGVPFDFDSFIGLSGPYGISHHFDYEAGRGVEELSPLKPSCGHSREEFHKNSPATRLARLLTDFPECDKVSPNRFLPPVLLVHGIEDTTVPFTATAEAATVLRSCGVTNCQELYVAQVGHQETVMHFMLEGRTKDGVMNWLENLCMKEDSTRRGVPTASLISNSKL